MRKINTYTIFKKNTLLLLAVIAFIAIVLFSTNHPQSYWFHYVWMAPVAFFIALTVNTLGISGAALFVPFFILIFPHISGDTLQTTDTVRLGLITESFGLSSSAIAFWLFGVVDKKIALKSILISSPIIVLGAVVTSFVPSSALYIMIALLLTVSAVMVVYEDKLREARKAAHNSKIDLVSTEGTKRHLTSIDGKEYQYCLTKSGTRKRNIGFGLGGFFEGANGFGVGELGIVSMILSKIPMRVAIGTNHIIVASTAIMASLIHFGISLSSIQEATGAFPWNIPIMTVPMVVIAGQLAPYTAAKIQSKYLERAIILIFAVISVSLVLLAIR